MTNTIQIEVYPASNIVAGETYGYVTHRGTMASTIKIQRVHEGVASAIVSHWGESFVITFDAETGEGVGAYKGCRLINLL